MSSATHATPAARAPRGRYAPSPTGLLHVGNARTALAAWLGTRSRGGSFVWRVEDLDPPRVVPGAAEAAMDDLAWMGLDWDEGPGCGGPFAPYVQSLRSEHYEAALEALHDAGRLFPCSLSRRELSSLSSAPHGPEDEAPGPPSPDPRDLAPGWFAAQCNRAGDRGSALRFILREETVAFVDRVQGLVETAVAGNFVLQRRDGLYAYQLAVVVDDWAMQVDEVVRGADLLSSTPRQLQLMDALGAPRPAHAHVPMVLDPEGVRLSKRHHSLTLRALREAGVRPQQLVGMMAWSLGLLDRPEAVAVRDLVPGFCWQRVGTNDWRLPADFPARVVNLR